MRRQVSIRPSSTPTALEARFGQRPIIFYTNGYETWLWDDLTLPAARGPGLLHQGRAATSSSSAAPAARRLTGVPINDEIVSRNYQVRAIRRIGGDLRAAEPAQALLVMATGTGKTRTAIALADLLIRANWVKRVLFLADRQALVTQAANAFKTAPARRADREPADGAGDGSPRLRLHLPDHAGADQRDTATGGAGSVRATSTW